MKMREQKTTEETVETRLLSIEMLQQYLSIGRNSALEFGKESGAIKRIGRRVLYDKAVIDKYIDSL